MFINPVYRTKVKICGLTTLEDARFSSGAMADYLGFIFYQGSPRFIEPSKAGAIINWLEGPKKVGVFVNQPLDDVNTIARQAGIDIVQLHGNESPEYCGLVEKPVIKAFHVNENKTTLSLQSELKPYHDIIEYYLFDSKTDGLWGGTGKSFNWNILKNLTHDKPYFLSGGLNDSNIKLAIETVKPAAVDLSSGLEESPGIKNFDKIERFFDVMSTIWQEQER